jgi:hypothetical protein
MVAAYLKTEEVNSNSFTPFQICTAMPYSAMSVETFTRLQLLIIIVGSFGIGLILRLGNPSTFVQIDTYKILYFFTHQITYV